MNHSIVRQITQRLINNPFMEVAFDAWVQKCNEIKVVFNGRERIVIFVFTMGSMVEHRHEHKDMSEDQVLYMTDLIGAEIGTIRICK